MSVSLDYSRDQAPDFVRTRYPEGPLLKDISELTSSQPVEEDVVHLSGVRVAIADYDLVQHDFPELRVDSLERTNAWLARLRPAQKVEAIHKLIDEWLIANAGVVSFVQAQQESVNTRIPVDGVISRAYRPLGYGRALIVPVTYPPRHDHDAHSVAVAEGLLDLKGVGVAPDKTPTPGPASDGLFALECALREYLMQRVIDLILARECPSFWTVPTYATLTTGFYMTGDWKSAPASIHVRRAHCRQRNYSPGDLTPHRVRMSVELLLREYGVTSTNPTAWIEISEENGNVVIEGRDLLKQPLTAGERGLCMALKGDAQRIRIESSGVQCAGTLSWPPAIGAMVDFGTIYVRRTFEHPVALDPRISTNVARPGTPGFVQPDPRKALRFDAWEPSKVKSYCRRLARRFGEGQLSPSELRTALEAPVRELVASWSGQ